MSRRRPAAPSDDYIRFLLADWAKMTSDVPYPGEPLDEQVWDVEPAPDPEARAAGKVRAAEVRAGVRAFLAGH